MEWHVRQEVGMNALPSMPANGPGWGLSVARRALLVLACFLSVALPRVAGAQQSRDPSTADALFKKAREAVARGDMATACLRFAESQRLDPAPGTLLNVAQCEEKEGKLAASHTHLSEALEKLPKDDFRFEYARARLAALNARVPTVTVTLAQAAKGARVTRDGNELGQASFGLALPLDPGLHTFVVRADGRQETREQITLREGQHATLTLSVGSVVTTTSNAHDGESDAGGGGRRTVAFGAFALGGAGLVTGVVTGLLFADSAATYRAHCDASGCDGDGMAAASRARTLNVVSPVAFGVGALGLGVGSYLLVTSKSAPARQGRLRIDPQVSSQTAGVVLRGGF
jgi:hypothetical protein